jgi:uncharacterized protein (DUF1499 family)
MAWIRSTAVVVIAMLLLCSVAAVAVWRNGVPLNAEPGVWERLGRYLGSNTVSTAEYSNWPELRPPHYGEAPDRLLAIAVDSARSLGWEVRSVGTVDADGGGAVLIAVVTTPLLGFQDDVRVRMVAVGDGRTRLEFHSASRVGRADLGANLGHWLQFRHALESRIRPQT